MKPGSRMCQCSQPERQPDCNQALFGFITVQRLMQNDSGWPQRAVQSHCLETKGEFDTEATLLYKCQTVEVLTCPLPG